ncbi:hypothetical protein AB0C59_14905 [Streptomyces sp. NPDC048664]|uniref:hypothetical protein n=1 Tax=Streptomyces sp. NPDC048664 TaxID=3154505 RepID=UPI0034218D1B
MYGHGAAPPTRSSGTVITMRVLYAVSPLLCCGLFSCVPLFRVAVLRGKKRDWLLAWLSLPLAFLCFAVVGSVPENDRRSDLGLGAALLLGLASGIYFLVVDIRQRGVPRTATASIPPGPPPQQSYGYPPAQPYTTHSTPTPVPPQPPYTPAPPHPQPQQPSPARIDQVRAELDELSDYLRKHQDNT